MVSKRLQFIMYAFLFPLGVCSQNLKNPVLPNVADAGVLKSQGRYYIGGVHTNGDFYVSEDLVHWDRKVHVLSMNNRWTEGTGAKDDQIHSNDMIYLNGKFHLYWSVNYWGPEKNIIHIAHAESDQVEGPYVETNKNQWMDNRIDPFVFKDVDGSLYMYMVRFTDGNTIWCRKLSDPALFAGEPYFIFSAQSDTWETMDNKVIEGPFVIHYRGHYYLLYNANHTATQWGNYQIGVAEASGPLLFNQANKYSAPVLSSNLVSLKDRFVDVLRYTKDVYSPLFNYTMLKPSGNWYAINYDDQAWDKGESGFANTDYQNSLECRKKTEWNSESLWIRKKFSIDNIQNNFALNIYHEGDTKVYLNGTLIYQAKKADFRNVNLTDKQMGLLRRGENLLAVETHKGYENRFDISVYDMKDSRADDVLYTPGQPNLVRGVNGFEWWLVYMGNKNKERRSQFIDRVHFFGNRLVVDGMTGPVTTGYHPAPSLPTLKMDRPNIDCIPEALSSSSYLFEVSYRPSKENSIWAWYKDKGNYVRVGIDEECCKWFIESNRNSHIRRIEQHLPDDFDYTVFHDWRIERDAYLLKIFLDDIPAPGISVFSDLLSSEKGVPGIKTSIENSGDFCGLLYTIGFDEYNEYIHGWLPSGREHFEISEKGLQMTEKQNVLVKGDLLDNYEFSLQMSHLSGLGEAGFCPVYIDNRNYVRAYVDGPQKKFKVSQIVNSKEKILYAAPVDTIKTVYSDSKYSDFMEKVFNFDSYEEIVGFDLPKWIDFGGLVDNSTLRNFEFEYLSENGWKSMEISTISHAYNYYSISCRSVKAKAIRIRIEYPKWNLSEMQKIRIHSISRSTYNLRGVKNNGSLYIFVDGIEIGSWKIDYRNSRVALFSNREQAVYNGLMYYHIGK